MAGGVLQGGWADPRPLIEARSLYSARLDPEALGTDWRPIAGLSVLLTLSGHEPLWLAHAVSVGMWSTTAGEPTYWLSEAARSSPEVFSYLETFGIPANGVPFAAAVVLAAFDWQRLAAAAQLLGVSHAICSQSCTFDGTLDSECYFSCMSGS